MDRAGAHLHGQPVHGLHAAEVALEVVQDEHGHIRLGAGRQYCIQVRGRRQGRRRHPEELGQEEGQEAHEALGQPHHHGEEHQGEDALAPILRVPHEEAADGQEAHGHHGRQGLEGPGGLLQQAPEARCQGQGKPGSAEEVEEQGVGEQVREQHHHRGAHEATPEALAAAQHHPQQEDDHQLVDEALGLEVLEVEGVEAAREPPETRAEGEGGDLVVVGAHAHGVRGDGAVAQGLEGPAPVGGQQVPHHHPDQGQQDQA